MGLRFPSVVETVTGFMVANTVIGLWVASGTWASSFTLNWVITVLLVPFYEYRAIGAPIEVAALLEAFYMASALYLAYWLCIPRCFGVE